jgi:hypothetical protein
MTDALARLDPAIRGHLIERLGVDPSAAASGAGSKDLLEKLLARAAARSATPPAPEAAAERPRTVLSLDKAWHGVHFVLCGQAEPGSALLSQAVLGGADIGSDPEGFSGYGPARYFTTSQTVEMSASLNAPQLEAEAASRFDAERMSELDIYPGWEASDGEWVMDAFRNLRGFFADAASKQSAVVTCLV